MVYFGTYDCYEKINKTLIYNQLIKTMAGTNF